eukprot:COSAG01_NODE_1691_length_9480_cov_5.430231_4_plen_172_part_00
MLDGACSASCCSAASAVTWADLLPSSSTRAVRHSACNKIAAATCLCGTACCARAHPCKKSTRSWVGRATPQVAVAWPPVVAAACVPTVLVRWLSAPADTAQNTSLTSLPSSSCNPCPLNTVTANIRFASSSSSAFGFASHWSTTCTRPTTRSRWFVRSSHSSRVQFWSTAH